MSLAGLLKQYPDALEAALQAEYGIDLLDLWRGSLSVRKVCALLGALPPGNAIERAADPQAAAWDLKANLLARVAGVKSLDEMRHEEAEQKALKAKALQWKNQHNGG